MYSSLEVCAGAGGQALGLELAGFSHIGLLEIEEAACNTMLLNRPSWNVIQGDLRNFSAHSYEGVDLLSGGVPCPPFSKAGKQLGNLDERDLFPEIYRLINECKPKAIMLENVRGLLDSVFDEYRANLIKSIENMGYIVEWKLLNASDFGVPQLRPRVVFVAMKPEYAQFFKWPNTNDTQALSVGESLLPLMSEHGWIGAKRWARQAIDIAPTLVGGSKKHGGPDLGPTRAKKAWASLGIDGHGISDLPPAKDFVGMPRLTVQMAARIQGFPESWSFYGKKTPAYRQVGNAFPPPVAEAVGKQIRAAFEAASKVNVRQLIYA